MTTFYIALIIFAIFSALVLISDDFAQMVTNVIYKAIMACMRFFSSLIKPKVTIPDFLNDKKLLLTASYLKKQKWQALESMLSRMDQQERTLFYQGITADYTNEEAIKDWSHQCPNSLFATIAMVYYHFYLAWQHRGGGLASSVSDKQAQRFYQELAKARKIILNIKKNDPDNIDAALAILNNSQTQFIDDQELYHSIQVLGNHCQQNIIGYISVLNTLTPKWGGSQQLMQDFVDENTQHIKVHACLVASKHVELWLNEEMKNSEYNNYFNNKAHHRELSNSYQAFITSSEKLTCMDHYVLNYFAVAFFLSHDYQSLDECIRHLKGHYMEHPWVYLGTNLLEHHNTGFIIANVIKQLNQ